MDVGARKAPADLSFVKPRSGAEIKAAMEAERLGLPFLRWRSGEGRQVIRSLPVNGGQLTIGRHSSCDVSLHWDARVSRTHAVLERIARVWALSDDGLSRNGTFVNGERIRARWVLLNGDTVRVGGTLLTFTDPTHEDDGETRTSESLVSARLTPMQRKVLVALCRPYRDGGPYASPASNATIAEELVLSVDAIKTHMRGLFERFDVGHLPQNQKRARVVELAFRTGVVTERDL